MAGKLCRLQLQFQRFAHSFGKPSSQLMSAPSAGHWRKLDSISLGIAFSMIPDSSRIILKILQSHGHDAFLVGGCVRDLLLHKVPKDFDVVTSANLPQIKSMFHRAYIVGRKFPICMVHVRGSVIEVSSFETVAKHASEKEVRPTEMPKGYDAKDFLRWRNSLHRDFTINSLFYDPFARRIYDYSNGMTDLKGMKLRTVVPAHLSFEEDCARILRGIRVAARLGFSFAKDTEKAICSLYASVTTLDKARLMLEMNYMLSYGAAEPSFILLKRFNILEILLPFQAAYLAELSGSRTPVMLLKLFSNLDTITSCDQPCNSGLWVSLLAFHQALVNNPQDAIVVWTFCSLLHHGNWKKGVKAARDLSVGDVHFEPEIYNSAGDITDEELSKRVLIFASAVQDSINMLIDSEGLRIAMLRYSPFPSSHLIWISKNAGKDASAIFNVLKNDIESLREERQYYNIDYNNLGKGDIAETRFALGKIIMDTMRCGTNYGQAKLATEDNNDMLVESSSIFKLDSPKGKDGVKRGQSVLDNQEHQQKAKKQKLKTQSRPETEAREGENQSSSISKLDSPKGKDGVKQGRSMLDNQKHQQKGTKQKLKKQTSDLEQKCVEDKLVEILSCQEIAQKRRQLKNVLVKDVKNLLSVQEATLENVKMEPKKHTESQTSKKVHSVIGKVAKIVSHHESHGPEEIKRVSGKVTGIGKRRMAQLITQQKEPRPIDMVNVISPLDIFKGDNKYPTKKDDREVKQETVGDRPRNEFITAKKTRKLSSIFK